MNGKSNLENSNDVRFFAIATAVSGAIFLGLPFLVVKVFALFGLIIFGWRFAFEGATVLSGRLSKHAHRTYQVTVALMVPLIMSLLFVFSSNTLNANEFFAGGWSLYDLIPVCILGCLGWVGGDNLNLKHPFRGYFIAATILLVLNYMWHIGMIGVDDYDGEGSSFSLDKEKASFAVETGYYFFNYLYQVTLVYSAMFVRQIRKTI